MENKRIYSFLVDMIVISLILSLLPFSLVKKIVEFSFNNTDFIVNFEYKFFIILVYFLVFDLFNKGKTIGKLIFKIKVVDIATNVFVFKQAVVRTLLKMISIVIFPISFFLMKFKKYTLHEQYSKTKTI